MCSLRWTGKRLSCGAFCYKQAAGVEAESSPVLLNPSPRYRAWVYLFFNCTKVDSYIQTKSYRVKKKKLFKKNFFPLISIILAEIFSHSSMWTWLLSYEVECLSKKPQSLYVSEQQHNQIVLRNPQRESCLLWWFVFTCLRNESYALQHDPCYK